MTHDPTPIGSFPVTEDDLQAWIDGRLPSGRLRDIEAWLLVDIAVLIPG